MLPSWLFLKIQPKKKKGRRYTSFFDEEMGFMNALWEQNVQIRRKFKFSVKFVWPHKSRKMSLLSVYLETRYFGKHEWIKLKLDIIKEQSIKFCIIKVIWLAEMFWWHGTFVTENMDTCALIWEYWKTRRKKLKSYWNSQIRWSANLQTTFTFWR